MSANLLPGQDCILHAPLSALFVLLLSLWIIKLFLIERMILQYCLPHS